MKNHLYWKNSQAIVVSINKNQDIPELQNNLIKIKNAYLIMIFSSKNPILHYQDNIHAFVANAL
jgi:selenocysteine-specific translation elongation factor